MQQWDGAKWLKVSDWIAPMKEKVRPLLEAAAKDYVAKNQPVAEAHRALRQVVVSAADTKNLSPETGRGSHSECY